MSFISTYRNLLQPFSFPNFLMIENHEQSALRKNPVITLLVKQLKTYFDKVKQIKFIGIYSNLKQYSEAVVQKYSVKKLCLEIS